MIHLATLVLVALFVVLAPDTEPAVFASHFSSFHVMPRYRLLDLVPAVATTVELVVILLWKVLKEGQVRG